MGQPLKSITTNGTRVLSKSKDTTELMLDAASVILNRIASNGISARDAAGVETLRNWVECAEEGRDAKRRSRLV